MGTMLQVPREQVAGGNTIVISAQAGIHFAPADNQWIPAFAGMTSYELSISCVDFRHAVASDQRTIESLEQRDFDAAALDSVRTASMKRATGGRIQR